MALKLDPIKSRAVANMLNGKFKQARTDRKDIEITAMRNLRQYRRKYDPDVEAKLKSDKRSQVYPGDTRTKVRGFVAKMMEMMYPAQGKNWSVAPTVVPSIPGEDLQIIITTLEKQVEAAQAEGAQLEVTSDMIENAVFSLAKERAAALEKEIEDQLSEMPIIDSELSKIALRSGSIYGAGYSKGPLATKKTERTHVRNKLTGMWETTTKSIPRPVYRPVSFWNFYPDLAAETWIEQNQTFEKMPFTRGSLRKLKKVGGVDGAALNKYLRDNKDGNFVEEDFDTELDVLNDLRQVADKNKRKYEVIAFRGWLSNKDITDLGVSGVKGDEADETLVEIWWIGDTIIKLDHTPFGDSPAEFYHAYIHGEDEDSGLIGIGLPDDIRDSQLSLCAAARMTQDNAAAVAGPIWIMNDDLMAKERAQSIAAFSVLHREGFGQEAQSDAVKQLATESHITELLKLSESYRATMDIESNLPAWIFGAPQPLGEAFRTTDNMASMQGGATMITKDHVRAFDNYVRSKIGSAIKWNQKFNKKKSTEGDFEAQPQGSKSLVVKELRGAALDQFWLSLTPKEQTMFDSYGVLKDRLEARDIPIDRLKPRSQAEAAAKEFEEAAAAAAQAEAGLTQAKTDKLNAETEETATNTQATAAKVPAEIEKMGAETQDIGDKTRLSAVETVTNSILPAAQGEEEPQLPFGGADVA